VSQANADAGIEVTSVPSGADVELGGNFIGNTPSTIGVSPGDHTISVKKSGYKARERKIKVSTGRVNISAELEAEVNQISAGGSATTLQELGTVSFTSDPPGAKVYIDNSSVGKAPITLNLKSRQRYARMFAKDYNNWSQQITVAAGSQMNLTATPTKSN
jgi:PEGA domain